MTEDMQKDYLKIVHLNEQDRANCQLWWDNTTTEEKLEVWALIQTNYDDPAMEIMSRFAQLSFSDMAERQIVRAMENTK